MSKLNDVLLSALKKLTSEDGSSWRLSVVKIKDMPEAHVVQFSSPKEFGNYLTALADVYLGGEEPLINDQTDIVKNDGALHETPVEYLSQDDSFFVSRYDNIIKSLANPSVEGEALCVDPNAIALSWFGNVGVGGKQVPLHILIKKKPFTVLKNHYFLSGNKFKPLSGSILVLPLKIDLMIVGKNVFLFSDSGATIVNDNVGQKRDAEHKLEVLKDVKFFKGYETLSAIGLKRKNLNLFRVMDEGRIELLKNKQFCERMARRFSIPCSRGVMDVSDPEDAQRLLKLLCMRGMFDPFKKEAVEVSGSTKWKKEK